MFDEQTLAQRIHDIMKAQLETGTGNGRRVRKVIVRFDSLEPVDTAALNAHWRRIATEPIFAPSHIEVHRDPPFGKCHLCNHEFELNADTARCPHCRCEQFKIIHGPPTIESYEIE